MDADLIPRAIDELRECWPYQEIPERHLRHWRDVLGAYPRDVVLHVLADAKRTMKGRPTWGEFGGLCAEYAKVLANRQRQGPFIDDTWDGPPVPSNEPGWLEAAAEAKRRLRAPTEDELLTAESQAAQRRAENERASKPAWWGVDA